MATSTINVRIPQISSLETAIRLYYERTELSNKDIVELFGKIGANSVVKLKNKAREVMIQDNVPSWNARHVNTAAAFKAWGLDISDLERRWEKLKRMEGKK